MEMVLHVRRSFQWLDRVNCTIFSAEVRLIKPDPAIYQHCLHCLSVAPSDCLFIDDREINIAAARVMGVHAIQFQSLIQLRSDLEQMGFHTLPPMSGVGNTRLEI
jgi:FMN phosphatase YigB (HAD superfamily)